MATISGFWDYQHNTTRTNFPELLKNGGESVISGIPTWTTFYITTPDGQHTYAPGVDPESITAFYQGLSIRNGVLTTAVTWVPVKDGPEYQITFTILAHRSRVNVGMMKVEVTSDTDGEVFVTDILDGAGAQRTEHLGKEFEARDDLIWTAVQPHGIEDVAAYEVSTLDFGACASAVVEGSRVDASERAYVSKNVSTVTQEYRLQLAAGETATLYKYVGIASSDAFKNPEKVARKAALKAKRDGWEQLLEEHDEAWNELWEDGDVIVDGDEVLQISVRATLFHLLSNIRGASEGRGLGDNSISVGGLTSDSYAGLVFWDADCELTFPTIYMGRVLTGDSVDAPRTACSAPRPCRSNQRVPLPSPPAGHGERKGVRYARCDVPVDLVPLRKLYRDRPVCGLPVPSQHRYRPRSLAPVLEHRRLRLAEGAGMARDQGRHRHVGCLCPEEQCDR